MIKDLINDKRSQAGLNRFDRPTTGKGSAPRLCTKPKWFGLDQVGETENSVIFQSGIATKMYVSKSLVKQYESDS